MTSTATKIAAGTSLVGLGGIAGLLLAPQQGDAERAASSVAQTPAPEVRTVHIKRVHHRTIHAKPKREHHAAAAQATAATPAVAPAAAPVPVTQAAPSPAPAPTQAPIRTRTSGTGNSGSGDDSGHEREHESEGGDD